jgi:hypothetical protein
VRDSKRLRKKKSKKEEEEEEEEEEQGNISFSIHLRKN